MKIFYFPFLLFLFSGITQLSAQSSDGGILPVPNIKIDSSRLPLTLMKLPFSWTPWDPIPDTPKVMVDMGVIDNGYNVLNHVADSQNVYMGKIGIEKRGSISQAFWYTQKSYGFETRNADSTNRDVVLLGMPKENDWVLYAPFDDHTLMRNVLTYQLGREMGYWTPRTKYTEVQWYDWAWTPDYRGLYVMMEKIKRGKNRVNISKLDTNDNAGDSLTGGYIFAVDKNIWANDSGWHSPKDTSVYFTYKYPQSADITPQQKMYLKAYVDSFETVMKSPGFSNPVTGYRKYIDEISFMDFFFIQELSKNIDGYKRSSYLSKDKKSKGGRIQAAPLWDFNSAWNVHTCGFDADTGWAYPMTCWVNASFHVPFWWGRLLQDSIYVRDMKCRWTQLRSTVLDTANIFHIMDSISAYITPASVRHFSRFTINTTLKVEADSLKKWIAARLKWMDAHMPGKCWNTGVNTEESFANSIRVYPNPSSGKFNVKSTNLKISGIEIFDMVGRNILSLYTKDGEVSIDISGYPAGVYFLKCHSDSEASVSLKIVKTD
jgi:hypothetical protein